MPLFCDLPTILILRRGSQDLVIFFADLDLNLPVDRFNFPDFPDQLLSANFLDPDTDAGGLTEDRIKDGAFLAPSVSTERRIAGRPFFMMIGVR